MKDLVSYINEYITPTPTLEWQTGSTDEFIDWGTWLPEEDPDADDCKKIAYEFYEKYPADRNDCGTIQGISVKVDWKNKNPWIDFIFYWGDADKKLRTKVIDELMDFLVDTIGGEKGGKTEIKNLLNNMTD